LRELKFKATGDGLFILLFFFRFLLQISGIVFPKYVQRWVNLKTIFSNFFDTGRVSVEKVSRFSHEVDLDESLLLLIADEIGGNGEFPRFEHGRTFAQRDRRREEHRIHPCSTSPRGSFGLR
jgi:hypothetical protein